MFFNRISLSLTFCFCLTTIAFASPRAPVGLTFNTGPTGSCNVSGTFTQYEQLNPQSHSSVSRHFVFSINADPVV